MTTRFIPLPLIGREIDVSLEQGSNLLKPNYVKLAGFPFTLGDQLHSGENKI